ncbi:DNA cytosine methyltransferase [Streptomyces sp. SID3212]|uniref:DNA cytosine methyltransferase n=1 Tax=Streptomyces sp. SID3212 TaxID=2690259 RepID=UPI001369ADF8|nr:DNA cytosine methyltransferase [Streptomyces sp. SID3212]MYV55041.1 DNA cytosine methyltransferase [Streptomyces sp. SID3212]
MSLTATDIFCGAGGSSTGLVAAGYELKLAANHSRIAIDTHSANHVNAEHVCADINNYDMRRLPTTDILWASPICTEISPAGGTPRSGQGGQIGIGDDYEPADPESFVRTRATAYDVMRAAEVHYYKAILCENVTEFATDWRLFDWWRQGIELLGYNSQIVSVSSAHVGAPGNDHAPQWRDRIYIVFSRTGIPLPDLCPRPLAWCPECGQDVQAVQSWRNGRTIGKYRQQYDYRCPRTRCGKRVVEPYVRPAADAIDWTNLGRRIGDRPRPLAANTISRIEKGLARYPQRASLLTLNHSGHDGRALAPEEGPLPARTRKVGEGLLIPGRHGMLVPAGGTWNNTTTDLHEPMRTRTTRDTEALVTLPYVVTMRRNGRVDTVDRPLAAVTAGGRHHGLVIPYRKGAAKPVGEPLLTLATRDSAGLLTPADILEEALRVEDCHFRMLQPIEQLAAQRFPADYIMRGNKTEQTMQAGNAVSCNVAQWLGTQVAAVL